MWKVKLTAQTFSSRWDGSPQRTGGSEGKSEINTSSHPHLSHFPWGLKMFSRFEMLRQISCLHTGSLSTPSYIHGLPHTVSLIPFFPPHFLTLGFILLTAPTHSDLDLVLMMQIWKKHVSFSKILTKWRQIKSQNEWVGKDATGSWWVPGVGIVNSTPKPSLGFISGKTFIFFTMN